MIITKRFENRHPLLGRIIHHDSRSRDFEFNTYGLQIKSVVHARHIPILDQGNVGSCTADAGIGDLGTSPVWDTLPDSHHYSLTQDGALSLYSDEEVLDGDGPYPPNDFGSSGLTCAKVLKRAGLISAYHWCFSPESALRALSITPFMFGTSWTDQMFTPDKDGRVHPHGPVMGGHEILCREFDNEGRRVWFDNSWGTAWGVDGRFYLTLEDFAHLLGHEGDVTILIPLQSMRTRTRRHHHKHHRHHK